MSSTIASVRSKRRRWEVLTDRTGTIGSAKDLLVFLVEKPLAAVIALWAVCLPALYFALYGDLFESVRTLSQLTVIFVMYLLIIIVGILSISFGVTYILSFRAKDRWSGHGRTKR